MSLGTRPFVGRDDDIARLAGRLDDGATGVLLTGEAGIGKSRLALAVARSTARDVVELRANSALQPIPLGALAPLLAELAVDVGDLSRALPELHAALAGRPGMLVVVDDVPALDPASMAAVEQLAVAGAARLVLTARDGQPLPAAVARLTQEGVLEPHVVGPLDADTSLLVLERALGGSIEPSTARALHTESGGNPLFLHELVAGAAEAGALRRGPHGWTLSDLIPSRRLVELVAARFEGLAPPARELLELVGAGQPLPLPAMGIVEAEGLAAAGLVQVDAVAGGSELRLSHPLYDEVLRRVTPPARWRAAAQAAAAILQEHPGDGAHLRAVTLLVDAGVRPQPDEATRAAQRAFSLLDHALAVRLADAALAVDPDLFRAALVRAGGLSAMQDVAALPALQAVVDRACGDEERALATQRLGLHLALRADDVHEAIRVSELALAELTDPGWRQFVAADLTKWRMMAGESVTEPEALGEVAGPARLNALLITALVSAMDGRADVCEAAVHDGLPLAHEHGDLLPNAADLLLLSRFLALTCRGDLERARDHVHEQLARVGDRQDEPLGMWSYALAVLDLHVGRCGAAERGAATATRALEWRDFTGLRPVARALRATALAQLGRAGEARDVLETIAEEALGDQKVALQHAQAVAWLLVREGDRRAAVEVLAERGRAGLAADHVLLGALTSYEAVRLGEAEPVLGDLEAAAQRATPGVVTAMAAHARGLADGDPAAIEAAADGLVAFGLATAAADALGQAAALHRAAGRSEAGRRALLRAAQLKDGLDGACGTTIRAPVLTPREREIAGLAAARERSREIALTLGVSPRTVDNHLASVYRKLGLTDRGQLAAALARLDGDAIAEV